MTTTPDMLKQFGGAPVSTNNFAGWWDNDVWFVDFDNGTRADGLGKDIVNPQKDLYRAITDSGAGDVIYMRPRKALTGEWYTAFYSSPASTEGVNWTIPVTKDHLSIIGTIKPGQSGGLIQKAFLTGYAGQTTPTLTVLAPYFCMENMGIGHASGQVNGLIKVDAYGATKKAHGAIINNCSFRNYNPGDGSLQAAVYFETSNYNLVVNSTFHKCLIGVYFGSAGGVPGNNAVVNCDFYGVASDLTCDIKMADVTYMLIDGNRFHHGLPSHAAGGSPVSKYVHVTGTTGTGILSNNYFGTTTTTIGTACTLQDIQGIGNKCENSTVWMTTT